MEHQLWKEIVAVIARSSKPFWSPHAKFSDARIVEVYYWAVLHDRPMVWACQRKNWPIHCRKQPLPSPSCMSRRLQSKRVTQRLNKLAKIMQPPTGDCLYWMIDGKPLVIGGCSKDRQASYGRAANSMAKGYKIHVIANAARQIAAWRLAPMNVDERKMARRMIREAMIQGYLVGDGNYDSNELHAACDARGNLQFVAPRRYGPKHGFGHRKQAAGRIRSKELLENPFAEFGKELLALRANIERLFGNLSSWGGGLTHLPPWVRTYKRVYRWVQAKLVITALKRQIQLRTYVA